MGFGLSSLSPAHMISGATDLFGRAAGGVFDFLAGPKPGMQSPFRPYDVSGPMGSMTYADGKMNLSLSPEQQAIQSMLSGAMAGGPYGLTPEQAQFSQMSQGLGGQALNLGAMSGMFGRGAGMQAANVGSGFLNAANVTDPTQIAGQQFDRMQALLSPRRERERLGLESRLMRQGLLGSTAGGEQFRAQGEANRMQDLGIAEGALRQGMDFQRGLFGMGMQGLEGGQGMFNRGTQQEMGGMATGAGFLAAPVDMQNQAMSNFMRMMQGQQSQQQSLLGLADLGMGAGRTQAGIDASNTAAQNAWEQNRSDAMMGLLSGGAQMMMGMPPTGFMSMGGQSSDPNAANFNWGQVSNWA